MQSYDVRRWISSDVFITGKIIESNVSFREARALMRSEASAFTSMFEGANIHRTESASGERIEAVVTGTDGMVRVIAFWMERNQE